MTQRPKITIKKALQEKEEENVVNNNSNNGDEDDEDNKENSRDESNVDIDITRVVSLKTQHRLVTVNLEPYFDEYIADNYFKIHQFKSFQLQGMMLYLLPFDHFFVVIYIYYINCRLGI